MKHKMTSSLGAEKAPLLLTKGGLVMAKGGGSAQGPKDGRGNGPRDGRGGRCGGRK